MNRFYGTVNECLNITPKICSVKESVDTVDSVGDNNKPYITSEGDDYYINWIPTRDNIVKSDGGYYLMDIEVEIGAGDCTNNNLKSLNLDINNMKLIAGDDIAASLEFATALEPYRFATDDENIVFENKLNANFSPYLGFGGKFVDKKLDYASAMLRTTFEVSNIAELTMKLEKSHTFAPIPIYTKDFIKIVMAGPVPIVITGNIRFMMVAEVNSNAEIISTLDTGTTLELDYGLEYKNGKWSVVGSKSFEYHIKAEAEGDVEATATITLIPDLSLTLYELAAAHVVVEPYLYTTVGVNGKLTAQYGNNSYIDATARFTKIEAGIGVNMKAYAGAAWDTSFESLKFPSTATYADISKNDFYNNKDKRVAYYEAIGKYEPFAIMKKTTLADILLLTQEDPIYDEIPPEGINTRAIKVEVGYKNIPNPFYNEDKEGSKKSYLPFEIWFNYESVTKNSTIITTDEEGEYWVIPEVNNDGSQSNTTVRFFAHSSLGIWAVQSIEVDIDGISSGQDAIPTYWSSRYVQEGSLLEPNDDNDNDGYTNLQEYQNGTNPLVKDSQPFTISAGDDQIAQEGELVTIDGTLEKDNGLDITYSWIENKEILGTSKELSKDDWIIGTHNITFKGEDTEGNIVTDDIIITITDTPPSTTTFSLGGDVTKEELKTSKFPFDITDDNGEINSIECTTDPSSITVSNTNLRAEVEIPNYDDISEFELSCVAYDVDSVELHSEAITITVSQEEEQPTSTGLGVIKKTGQITTFGLYDDGYYDDGIPINFTKESNYILDSKWRLPSRRELTGLIDYGDSSPAMNDKFVYTASGTYWSSTMSIQNSDNLWAVNFEYGTEITISIDNGSAFFRCVEAIYTPVANAGGDRIIEEGEKISFSGKYSTMPNAIDSYQWSSYYNNALKTWNYNSDISIDNIEDSFLDGIHYMKLTVKDSDGHESVDEAIITIVSDNKEIKVTGQDASYGNYDDGHYKKGIPINYYKRNKEILDRVTGLTWHNNGEPNNSKYNWGNAKKYCSGLDGSWRLPTRGELSSIIQYDSSSPSINKRFENIESDKYWTLSESRQVAQSAWTINFEYGTESTATKITEHFTRCVKGSIPMRANAGEDQYIEEGQSIILSAKDSIKSETIQSYIWSEDSEEIGRGETIELHNLTEGEHRISLMTHSLYSKDNMDIVLVTIVSDNKYIKETGQYSSYNSYDNGYYQDGVSINYERNVEKVIDKATGLTWLDNSDSNNSKYDWEDAKRHCFGEWRLPTRKELGTIVQYDSYNPSINRMFNYTASSAYWTLTKSGQENQSAWTINFQYGTESPSGMSNLNFVRCVNVNLPIMANAGGVEKTIQEGDDLTLSGIDSPKIEYIDNFTWLKDGEEVGYERDISLKNLIYKEYNMTLIVKDDQDNESQDSILVHIAYNQKDIKQTGQETSYADYDDGYYKRGTSLSYEDNGNTIRDNTTELVWRDDDETKEKEVSWRDAKLYCQRLDGRWRIPTRVELGTIIDYEEYDPSIDYTFYSTASKAYWTLDTSNNDEKEAWTIDFQYGTETPINKDTLNHIRCIKAN